MISFSFCYHYSSFCVLLSPCVFRFCIRYNYLAGALALLSFWWWNTIQIRNQSHKVNLSPSSYMFSAFSLFLNCVLPGIPFLGANRQYVHHFFNRMSQWNQTKWVEAKMGGLEKSNGCHGVIYSFLMWASLAGLRWYPWTEMADGITAQRPSQRRKHHLWKLSGYSAFCLINPPVGSAHLTCKLW